MTKIQMLTGERVVLLVPSTPRMNAYYAHEIITDVPYLLGMRPGSIKERLNQAALYILPLTSQDLPDYLLANFE